MVGISGGRWSMGISRQGHEGTTAVSILSHQPLLTGEMCPGWAALSSWGPGPEGKSWGKGIGSEPGTVLVCHRRSLLILLVHSASELRLAQPSKWSH